MKLLDVIILVFAAIGVAALAILGYRVLAGLGLVGGGVVIAYKQKLKDKRDIEKESRDKAEDDYKSGGLYRVGQKILELLRKKGGDK